MRVIKRGGIDRRTGLDRRVGYDIAYFLGGGRERRAFDERRTSGELRGGWIRVSRHSSAFVGSAI